MAIDLQKLEQKFNALLNDTNFVNDFEQWLEARNVSQNAAKPIVSGSLPIEEVALHAADDWYDTAKFRSDVRADLKSYYEGFIDAMRFCQGNDR
jgi:hypothetical protein